MCTAIMSLQGTMLGDLEAICSALQDDKVTIRKKAADKLNDLLQNPSVISLLNHQTKSIVNFSPDLGNGRPFTWDNLYRATFRFMLKEAEKLQRDNEKNAQISG